MAGVWLMNYDKSEVKSKRARACGGCEQKGDEEKIGKANVAQIDTQNANQK